MARVLGILSRSCVLALLANGIGTPALTNFSARHPTCLRSCSVPLAKALANRFGMRGHRTAWMWVRRMQTANSCYTFAHLFPGPAKLTSRIQLKCES